MQFRSSSVRLGTGLTDHTCHGNTKTREIESQWDCVPTAFREQRSILCPFFFFLFPEEVSRKDEMLFGVFVPSVSKWVLQGPVRASKPRPALSHSQSRGRGQAGPSGFDGALS